MGRDDDLIPQHEPVFQISIVARMIGLHQQTIRSYERIGLVKPHRTQGNTRLYSHADVERLQTVTRLVSDLGVNLAGVDVILRMTKQIEELHQELERVTTRLREAERRLNSTDAPRGTSMGNSMDAPRDSSADAPRGPR